MPKIPNRRDELSENDLNILNEARKDVEGFMYTLPRRALGHWSAAKNMCTNIEDDVAYIKDKIDNFPKDKTFPTEFILALSNVFAVLEQLTAEM